MMRTVTVTVPIQGMMVEPAGLPVMVHRHTITVTHAPSGPLMLYTSKHAPAEVLGRVLGCEAPATVVLPAPCPYRFCVAIDLAGSNPDRIGNWLLSWTCGGSEEMALFSPYSWRYMTLA